MHEHRSTANDERKVRGGSGTLARKCSKLQSSRSSLATVRLRNSPSIVHPLETVSCKDAVHQRSPHHTLLTVTTSKARGQSFVSPAGGIITAPKTHHQQCISLLLTLFITGHRHSASLSVFWALYSSLQRAVRPDFRHQTYHRHVSATTFSSGYLDELSGGRQGLAICPATSTDTEARQSPLHGGPYDFRTTDNAGDQHAGASIRAEAEEERRAEE